MLIDSSTLLKLIRNDTAEWHQKLDSKTILSKLIRPNLSEAELNAILLVFYRNLKEFVMCDIAQTKFASACHRRLTTLEKDLGLSKDESLNFQNSEEISEFNLGKLYVWEGSKLGGQFIYKALKNNVNLENQSFEFFKSDPSQLSKDWKAFQDLLIESITTESAYKEFIAGALHEFKKLYQEFLILGHER